VAQLRWLRANPSDFEADLPRITTPCLLYSGAADEPTYIECQECVAHMPNTTFLGLPGLNHVGAAGASDLLAPHIKRFLAAI
jgi:pimeloyl-ACP methyl ester carboxylesterase